jgi:recombination protein RecT
MSTPTTLTKSGQAAQRDGALKALAAFLGPREKNLQTFARNGVQPSAMIKLALFEASQGDWLTKVSPASVYTALVVAAQLGLEPAGLRGEAYLIPFGGECKLMPGYRGLIKLALNSGKVRDITAHVVYEGDDFAVLLGTEEKIHHVPMLNRVVEGGKAPEVIAAYAVATMSDGSKKFEVMQRWELDQVRAVSKQANGDAWAKWPDQMYRKAPVRRLAKYLPLGDDYFRAARIDELVDDGNATNAALSAVTGAVIDIPDEGAVETPEPVSRIEAATARAVDPGLEARKAEVAARAAGKVG